MSSLASDRRFLSAVAKTRATAAVIEEARRRQRQRRLLGTVAAAALTVIAGGVLLVLQHSGRTSQAPTTTHGLLASPQPSIKLYLRRDASPTAIRNTIASVRHEQGVARVTFVSRDEALRVMKRRYPNLLSNVVYNPLTDVIDVRLTAGRARSSIVSQLKRLRIVEHISYSAANKDK